MPLVPKSREIKLVLVGCAGVGKSSLFMRLVRDQFDPVQEPTMGAAFKSIYTEEKEDGTFTSTPVNNDNLWMLSVWDTAGQERYEALGPMYYRDADVAMVVTDDSKMGLDRARIIIKRLRDEWAPKNKPICIVQNKCDLPGFKYHQDVFKDFNVNDMCYASALTGENVNAAFMRALKLGVDQRKFAMEHAPKTNDDATSSIVLSDYASYASCCHQ